MSLAQLAATYLLAIRGLASQATSTVIQPVTNVSKKPIGANTSQT
jgi:hypothetical protein